VLPISLHAEVFDAESTHVSDGDTLWVLPVGGNVPKKLRLLGLDAPEICQPGGVASRDALRQLVAHKRLRVSVNFQDSYDRGLARIRVDGLDVGALMVQSGQAWSNRWHHSLGPYAQQENQARAGRSGLFADLEAELPRDFRKRVGSCYPAR
jgi:endonuclease YncB( thermonuclease family)